MYGRKYAKKIIGLFSKVFNYWVWYVSIQWYNNEYYCIIMYNNV
jgi:hypothetical protein